MTVLTLPARPRRIPIVAIFHSGSLPTAASSEIYSRGTDLHSALETCDPSIGIEAVRFLVKTAVDGLAARAEMLKGWVRRSVDKAGYRMSLSTAVAIRDLEEAAAGLLTCIAESESADELIMAASDYAIEMFTRDHAERVHVAMEENKTAVFVLEAA